MVRTKWLGLVVLLLAGWGMLVGCDGTPSPAQTRDGLGPYAEDGTTRRIRAFIHQYIPDPQFLLGKELGRDKHDDRTIVYFENLALSVDAQGQVAVEPLGEQFALDGQPYLDELGTGLQCEDISGHRVCYAFLEVFEKFGGLRVFGPPLGDIETDGLRIYQEFRNARMLLNYESRYNVVLDRLGLRAWQLARENRPHAGPSDVETGTEHLQVKILVERPVIRRGEVQHLAVLITDDQYHPKAGFTASVMVTQGENGQRTIVSFQLGPTNENGLAHYTLPIDDRFQPGKVYLQARVTYQDETIVARRSFRVVEGP